MPHRANRRQGVLAERQAKGSAPVGGTPDKYAGCLARPAHDVSATLRTTFQSSALPQGGSPARLGSSG